ncbi:hypothetical protein Tco_1227389 [Tanacetum coccineum]
MDVLTKRPKEILASELQLQLPSCPLMVETPKKENLDRYCGYHGERGHYTNDCYQLKIQLEAALKFGKLSHRVIDVRQQGNIRGRQQGNNNSKGKVINMVWAKGDNQKRKSLAGREEDWMNALITFPPILADNVSDEPLIIEAEVEGYLVRRVPMPKDYGEDYCSMASSPYNIILGRTRMRELRSVSSTIHAMMKFPTPRGIATLVARTTSVFECRLLEKKQTEPECKAEEEKPKILQRVPTPTDKLAKKHHGCVRMATLRHDRSPRPIIRHTLDVNVSVPPVVQKRRVLGMEKSKAVMKDVEEWVKAGIMRPVRYPT